MSTNAIFTFKDSDDTFHVFMHHDGYPSGAADAVRAVLDSGKSWGPFRFEANEFAAGFVAANKEQAGGIRLSKSRRAYGVEYAYTVAQGKEGPTVAVYRVDTSGDWKETKIWAGLMSEFVAEGRMRTIK